jgi:hypothetical protein
MNLLMKLSILLDVEELAQKISVPEVVPEAPRGRFRYTVVAGQAGTAQKKFVIGSTLSGYV